MAKITALIVQKRNPQRVQVYLDGRRAFGLHALEAARLKVGQELGPEDLAELSRRDTITTAHERALRFLSYRPRSQAEVRKHLLDKAVPPDVVDEVLARLGGVGLVDDEAFARYWRENRETFRPKGARALRAELRLKGVAREVIDETLAGLDEEAAALALARARAKQLRELDKLTFKRRLGAYLGRRGYGYDVIGPVVDRVWRELSAGAAEAGRHDED